MTKSRSIGDGILIYAVLNNDEQAVSYQITAVFAMNGLHI